MLDQNSYIVFIKKKLLLQAIYLLFIYYINHSISMNFINIES